MDMDIFNSHVSDKLELQEQIKYFQSHNTHGFIPENFHLSAKEL